jgi:hypothetical protein
MLIVKNGTLQIPRATRTSRPTHIRRGEPLPEGALPPAEVQRLFSQGFLVESVPAQPEPAGLPPVLGKWCRDPASLAGRTLEQLRLMAAEIDPDCGCEILNEPALVQLLTADWDPAFALPHAASSDRSRPAAAKVAKAKRLSEG